jgi:hypothetical protein
MYPAIEINLHLDRICAAQRKCSGSHEATFQASTYGTNLLPHRHILAEEPTARSDRRDGGESVDA